MDAALTRVSEFYAHDLIYPNLRCIRVNVMAGQDFNGLVQNSLDERNTMLTPRELSITFSARNNAHFTFPPFRRRVELLFRLFHMFRTRPNGAKDANTQFRLPDDLVLYILDFWFRKDEEQEAARAIQG